LAIAAIDPEKKISSHTTRKIRIKLCLRMSPPVTEQDASTR